MAQTIDLDFRTRPDVCKELVNLEFTYGRDRYRRKYTHQMFVRLKKGFDKNFSEWFEETNTDLLEDIKLFVDDSLSTSCLFEQTKSNILHAANVIIGMASADYGPTLDLIEQHIECLKHDIRVHRIGSGLSKKSNLLEALSQVRGQENILFMIDQTETVDFPLLKSLIDSLHELLQETSTHQILVLFCMSKSTHTIEKIMPIRLRTLMSDVKTIVKDPNHDESAMISRVLAVGNFSFNLTPELVSDIIDEFLFNNPSVTNLKYLCQYSLFQHCTKNKLVILQLPQDKLTQVLESEPNLISNIKELKSMTSHANNLNWKDLDSVACWCCDQIKNLKNYNQFILEQMWYYFEIVRDGTGNLFSTYIEIYHELVQYDDLGHSPSFVNAISNLQKCSKASLLERLQNATKRDQTSFKVRGIAKDIYPTLKSFEEKLINNDNSKDIVIDLIDTLLKQTQELRNPLKMPLSEVIYYSNSKLFHNRVLPMDWVFTPSDFTDKSTPFGMMYDLIHGGAEEISAADLFADFKCRFEEVEIRKRIDSRLSNSGLKVKVRPKKLRNTMAPLKIDNDQGDIIDEGLLKALFLDLLIDMENIGLLKSDKRMSARGTIKVCHWFD